MRIGMEDHGRATIAGAVVPAIASVSVISGCPTISTWLGEASKSVNTQLWQVSETKRLLKA